MTMPLGNDVSSEKMQFPSPQWFPDERDGFISWLRGEFAAANAIIDLVCQHLKSVGYPGEYEYAISCIHQRRCNWSPVLHMQQYFPIGEVMAAFHQVSMRKHQRHFDKSKYTERKNRQFNPGYHQGYKTENHRENSDSNNVQPMNATVETHKEETRINKKEDGMQRIESHQPEEKPSPLLEAKEASLASSLCKSAISAAGEDRVMGQGEKEKLNLSPTVYVGAETFDGKEVNVVEGLKMYEGVFDSSKISWFVTLSQELRAAGRKGELQGQTFAVSKTPMKGHGREMIQLGIPVANGPHEDEFASGTSKDRRVAAIPNLLNEAIQHLMDWQIMSVKPDSCIIDFFKEGDHLQPHMCPPWYERPFCYMFLTECNMVFGRAITTDHPGSYRGAIRLPLKAGSVLVMQGKSADFAKHAIPSMHKSQILVTFTKSLPKKYLSSTPSLPNTWAQSPITIRSGHIKQFGLTPATGVLPAPITRPQHLTPPSAMQPIVMSPPIPFPTPTALSAPSSGWTPVPVPQHPPPPRLLLPGTGVFLPPGTGHLSSSHPSSGTTTTEASSQMNLLSINVHEKEVDKSKSLDIASNGTTEHSGECNGNLTEVNVK